MEARAPYHTAPKPSRNLAEPIAAWLREQGFAVIEHQYDGQATVAALWTGPRNEQFQLSYIWVARYASATLQLQACWPGQEVQNLFGKEAYEAQKSLIESDYDAKTRAVKKDAAEKEKEFNIAQAIIAGALAVIKAAPNIPLQIAAGATAAAGIAKIIATPIPEFEDGGVFGGAKPGLASRISRAAGQAWRGVKQFATGGRINPTAGVADAGQRHSGGGIRMVDGATGQHLGEWERGEAYMILSRDTYANNKHLVDELIDTSLHRGGAPVRQREGYYEDGGTFGGSPTPLATTSARADGQELVQLLRKTRDAIRALPNRQFIGWDQEDTAELEQRLNERAEDRSAGQIR